MACRMQERSYSTRHSQFPRGKSGQTPLQPVQPVMRKARRSRTSLGRPRFVRGSITWGAHWCVCSKIPKSRRVVRSPFSSGPNLCSTRAYGELPSVEFGSVIVLHLHSVMLNKGENCRAASMQTPPNPARGECDSTEHRSVRSPRTPFLDRAIRAGGKPRTRCSAVRLHLRTRTPCSFGWLGIELSERTVCQSPAYFSVRPIEVGR